MLEITRCENLFDDDTIQTLALMYLDFTSAKITWQAMQNSKRIIIGYSQTISRSQSKIMPQLTSIKAHAISTKRHIYYLSRTLAKTSFKFVSATYKHLTCHAISSSSHKLLLKGN